MQPFIKCPDCKGKGYVELFLTSQPCNCQKVKEEQKEKEESSCVISSAGTKRWYLNGQLHREEGPAVEFSSGVKHWYINGNLHREDGPACEYSGDTKYWYLNGRSLSEEEFEEQK